ncbi:hypothetical protein Sjap_025396 [Stephania japonica]|uniref:Uncharacterized protein n=1 Tax=Stephania japonica TaxID=461633 RepID=A0AAP0E1I7_9MAGN
MPANVLGFYGFYIQGLTDSILANCGDDHPLLKDRATNLKSHLLNVSNLVLSEACADPLFRCMIERMRRVVFSREDDAQGEGEDVYVICQNKLCESAGFRSIGINV